MQQYGVTIAGTGSYVPEKVLTNADLERMVETTDEWIRTRTGIEERHIAAPDEPCSAIAAEAARRAMDAAGVQPDEIEFIIVATFTGDNIFPNTGCYLQKRLGAFNAAAISVEAACTGFLYGLELAGSLIRAGQYKTILLVGSEKISSIVDWTDRNTCVLFGDGAGAVVLKRTAAAADCLKAVKLGADGRYTELLHTAAGGSLKPLSPEDVASHQNCIKMEGREIFKLAVNAMVEASRNVMEKAGVTHDDIRWVIPHQANLRIISSVGKYLDVPDDKVYVNVNRYGNTSAASIPLALDEVVRSGSVQRGDVLLLTAFGAGLTWGAAVVKW